LIAFLRHNGPLFPVKSSPMIIDDSISDAEYVQYSVVLNGLREGKAHLCLL
jgi:hypothetical protein